MAETPEELTKKLAEILDKGLFPKFKELESVIAAVNEAQSRGIKLDKLNLSAKQKSIEEEKILQNKETQLSKAYTNKINEIYQSAKQGDITRAEAQQKIIQLRDATADALANPELEIAFRNQAASIERNAEANNRVTSEFSKTVQTNLTGAVKALSSSFGSLMGSYQSGSSQIGTGAEVLKQTVGLAGAGISTVGKAAGAAGGALSMIPGPAMAVGAGLTIVGSVLGLVGSGLSQTASTVLPFLQAELEKNINAFQSLSSSGAMFSDGLGGMIRAAHQGGLTIAQLDNVVKNSRDSIAALGEGTAAGTSRVTRALGAGGDSFRKSLLNLGFSVEEQGVLVAETMAAMRQSGGKLTSSDAEVAEQTRKYAENLRIVSSITGEDAKKKQQFVQQQNIQLGVQQKLAALGTGPEADKQRAAFTRAQANMSELQIKALNEMIVSGGQIITPELAATVAQMPSLGASLTEMHSLFNQGALDETNTRTIQAQRGEAIKQEMLSQTGIGLAGIAKVGGMAEALAVEMGKELAFRNKFTPEATAAAALAAKKQAETDDEQTKKMNDAILATQKAMMETQKAVLDVGVMTAYSGGVALATTAMLEMVEKFRKEISKMMGLGANEDEPKVDTAPTTTSRRRRTLERLGEGLDGVAPPAPSAPPAPPTSPPALTTQPQEDNRSSLQKFFGMSARGRNAPLSEEIAKFSKGGIIDGPSTGTLAMLHGKEIVMPLPTNFDISDLLKQANNQIAATGQIIDPQLAQMMSLFGDDMKNSTNAQKISLDTDQQIAALMQSLNVKFDDMIDHMREVVANTDRTARGVA